MLCCYSSDPSGEMVTRAKQRGKLTPAQRVLALRRLSWRGGFRFIMRIRGFLAQTTVSVPFSYSQTTSSTKRSREPATPCCAWNNMLFLIYSLKHTIEYLNLNSDSQLQYEICRSQNKPHKHTKGYYTIGGNPLALQPNTCQIVLPNTAQIK